MLLSVFSFLRALWAMRKGDTRTVVYYARLRTCQGCPQIAISDRGIHCNACGCPKWAMSDLRTKTRIIDYRCPLNKW